MREDLEGTVVCVVGLGYAGLPLAEAFSKSLKVIGFDNDIQKINRLIAEQSTDRQRQPESPNYSVDSVSPINSMNLVFTTDPNQIGNADYIIVCVPTPVTKSKEPDLSYVKSAAAIVSQNIKKGSVVIIESTFYPGVTEEVVKPILEAGSKLKCGSDFKIAYSPERINPGDKEHTLDKITKVVAGMDEETTGLVAELYRKVTSHIFKAKDIKTAEAAKVIENIQRDLNIALMNELAIIFEKMNLNTKDVVDAAATKWNFHRYSPGLVGGHCIPVDPYYLVYKARELGYHPQVILAGRAINDYMPKHIAEVAIKALNDAGKVIKGSKVLIMGLTYKENVADIRETPAKGIIKELGEYGAKVIGYDPLVDTVQDDFDIEAIPSLEHVRNIDCIILATAHRIFEEVTLGKLRDIMSDNPILIDVRGMFNKNEAQREGIIYKTL